MENKILELFFKKELQKTNQKVFRIEKIIQGKVINYMSIWKGYDNFLNSWIDKKSIFV